MAVARKSAGFRHVASRGFGENLRFNGTQASKF
jgi:hypothetical protein